MTEPLAGTPTLHGRAEAWECDFNGHWNTRFYCRAFQTAGEVAAALDQRAEDVVVHRRLIRFHSELHSADPIEIRSFALCDAGEAPATAHYMLCHGKSAATALDEEAAPNRALAPLGRAEARLALPRGLTGAPAAAWTPDPARDVVFELGPVGADERHDDGTLRFEPGIARLAVASHHHAVALGYTHDFTKQSGIGRMLVEMRYTRLGSLARGGFLRGASRLTAASGKSYRSAHLLYDHAGAPVALYELCTLAVDMTARRATALPAFLRDAVIA